MNRFEIALGKILPNKQRRNLERSKTRTPFPSSLIKKLRGKGKTINIEPETEVSSRAIGIEESHGENLSIIGNLDYISDQLERHGFIEEAQSIDRIADRLETMEGREKKPGGFSKTKPTGYEKFLRKK
jgi:hypothetical protein